MFFKRKALATKVTAAVRERPVKERLAKAPPAKVAAEPEGELDVRALGRALWRRKRAIIIPTLIVTALAAVAVHVISPHYKSSATILYEGRENIFLRPDVDKATADRGPADEVALTSQVQLMLSRELAIEVIKKLKLNENPEFDPVLNGIPPWKYALMTAGIVRNPLQADRRGAGARGLLREAYCLSARPLARHHHRIHGEGSEACGARRQRGRGRLPRAAAAEPPAADHGGRRMAEGRDRQAAAARRRGRGQGRGVPQQEQPVPRHQQHDAVEPGARRVQLAARAGAGAEGGCADARPHDPRHAQERWPIEASDVTQFRPDPPPVGAARHAARAARRAVGDAARQPSAHQGARRRRSPISTRRSAPRPRSWRARSRTTRGSRTLGSTAQPAISTN